MMWRVQCHSGKPSGKVAGLKPPTRTIYVLFLKREGLKTWFALREGLKPNIGIYTGTFCTANPILALTSVVSKHCDDNLNGFWHGLTLEGIPIYTSDNKIII